MKSKLVIANHCHVQKIRSGTNDIVSFGDGKVEEILSIENLKGSVKQKTSETMEPQEKIQ